MTPAGWVMMILAVGGVTALLAWCIHKVVSTRDSSDRIHSQVDIETGDAEDT